MKQKRRNVIISLILTLTLVLTSFVEFLPVNAGDTTTQEIDFPITKYGVYLNDNTGNLDLYLDTSDAISGNGAVSGLIYVDDQEITVTNGWKTTDKGQFSISISKADAQKIEIKPDSMFTYTYNSNTIALCIGDGLKLEKVDGVWVRIIDYPITKYGVYPNSTSGNLDIYLYTSDDTILGNGAVSGLIYADDQEITVTNGWKTTGKGQFSISISKADAQKIEIKPGSMFTYSYNTNKIALYIQNGLRLKKTEAGEWEKDETVDVEYYQLVDATKQAQFNIKEARSASGWYTTTGIDIDGTQTSVNVYMGDTAAATLGTFGNKSDTSDNFIQAVADGKTIHVSKLLTLTNTQENEVIIEFPKEFWLYSKDGVYLYSEEQPAVQCSAKYDKVIGNQMQFTHSMTENTGFWTQGTVLIGKTEKTVGIYFGKGWGVFGNINDAFQTAIQTSHETIKIGRYTIAEATDGTKYELDFGSDIWLVYVNGAWTKVTTEPIGKITVNETVGYTAKSVEAILYSGNVFKFPEVETGFEGWVYENGLYGPDAEITLEADVNEIAIRTYTLIIGDVNDDVSVDVRDAVRLKRYLGEQPVIINEINADTDQSEGTINAADLDELLNIIVKKN